MAETFTRYARRAIQWASLGRLTIEEAADEIRPLRTRTEYKTRTKTWDQARADLKAAGLLDEERVTVERHRLDTLANQSRHPREPRK